MDKNIKEERTSNLQGLGTNSQRLINKRFPRKESGLNKKLKKLSNMKEKIKHLEVSEKIHTKLKIMASKEKVKLRELVEKLFQEIIK